MPYKAYSKELGRIDSDVEVVHIAHGKSWRSASMSGDTEVRVFSLRCTDEDNLQIHGSVIPKNLCVIDDKGIITEIPEDELFNDTNLLKEVSAGEPVPNVVLGDNENNIKKRMIIKYAETDRPALTIHMPIHMPLGDAAMEAVIILN